MKAITKILAGGVAMAALAVAAPAAAQYYPGYGYPGYGYGYPGYGYPGYGGNVVGSIINSVTGGGYGGYGYNMPGGSQVAANQCSAAVQQRLGGYGGYGYGYGAPGRVAISSVEIRNGGGYKVRGVAAAPGYGYAGGNIGFTCRTDPRGLVTDVDINNGYYGYNGYENGYQEPGYANPYSVYGYQRY